MKKAIFTFSMLMLIGISVVNASSFNVNDFFSKSDAFLSKYVKAGRVDYKGIKANLSEIENLYKTINSADLSSSSEAEKKAFYINAYNLIVIYQVSKYYPLKSPLDQSGFFDKVKHNVAGAPMTLNFLEIKKLILAYKDPRIHFVLACAAVSCPPLASFAYVPAKIEAQLDERTKLAINNTEWLRVNKSEKKVMLSKIFDWYQKDFTMNGANSVIDFINKYKNEKIPASYQVTHYEYDWSLNES